MGYDANPEHPSSWNLLPRDIKLNIASDVCSPYELYKLKFAQISKECMYLAGFKTVTELASAIKEHGVSQKREEYRCKLLSPEYQRKQFEKMSDQVIFFNPLKNPKMGVPPILHFISTNPVSMSSVLPKGFDYKALSSDSSVRMEDLFKYLNPGFSSAYVPNSSLNITLNIYDFSPVDAAIAQGLQPIPIAVLQVAPTLQQNQNQDSDSEDDKSDNDEE